MGGIEDVGETLGIVLIEGGALGVIVGFSDGDNDGKSDGGTDNEGTDVGVLVGTGIISMDALSIWFSPRSTPTPIPATTAAVAANAQRMNINFRR